MKYEIKNRYTGEVQFTADIDCEENAPTGLKVGLSAKWGVVNNANLSEADLCWADLREADLRGADLREADLREANLSRANLREANLSEADLRWADLRWADLREAGLIVLQLPLWTAYITKTHTKIGCEYHANEEWLSFADERIGKMDSHALEWWKIHKPLIAAAMAAVNQQASHTKE